MYILDIYKLGHDFIEYEFKWVGNYGAKGEKRGPRKKKTPEAMAKQNQFRKETHVRRLIRLNFRENDYWITLKYPKGRRPSLEEVTMDVRKFIRNMRNAYQKRGSPFMYIYRLEIGKHGGIHLHMICNRISSHPGTDVLVSKYWQVGLVNYELLYDTGGYEALAEYIVKQPDEEIDGQLYMFDKESRKQLLKYSCSRNLKKPVKERKEYKRKTMRRILTDGPEPSHGYYIDKNSIYKGINPYTGMSYLYYTEIRIRGRDRPHGEDTS